jgi:predicted MFS family arabinose efflux permease
VPTLSLGGFLTGTLFLVPLGDRYDKRLIILAKFCCLMASILVIAVAPTLTVLATRPTARSVRSAA